MEKTEQALAMFRSGFNCAQAVFSAFCEKYGVETNTALKLACGFGGGFRCGEVCGAASGAVLVIGARHGHILGEDKAAKFKCYDETAEFMRRFGEKNGGLTCQKLLGCDIATPAGLQQARQQGLFQTVCEGAIDSAILLLQQMGY